MPVRVLGETMVSCEGDRLVDEDYLGDAEAECPVAVFVHVRAPRILAVVASDVIYNAYGGAHGKGGNVVDHVERFFVSSGAFLNRRVKVDAAGAH